MNAGEKYFEKVVPEVAQKHVRMDVYEVCMLQYLSPNQTRFVKFHNYDPKIGNLSANTVDAMMKDDTIPELKAMISYIEGFKNENHKLFKKHDDYKNQVAFFMEDF